MRRSAWKLEPKAASTLHHQRGGSAHPMHRHPPGRIVRFAMLAPVLGLQVVFSARISAHAAGVPARVTMGVDSAHAGASIPSNFVGLSYESAL